jgi:hypothetical protein
MAKSASKKPSESRPLIDQIQDKSAWFFTGFGMGITVYVIYSIYRD